MGLCKDVKELRDVGCDWRELRFWKRDGAGQWDADNGGLCTFPGAFEHVCKEPEMSLSRK